MPSFPPKKGGPRDRGIRRPCPERSGPLPVRPAAVNEIPPFVLERMALRITSPVPGIATRVPRLAYPPSSDRSGVG